MIPSFQEENGYGIPGNDGKQRMEAGRAKNQIPYCTVVLVALNVILFLIGLILPKAGEWMESEGRFSVVYLLYEHSGFYRLITVCISACRRRASAQQHVAAYCCGDVVERCLGKVRFDPVFWLCDFRKSAFCGI